MSRKRGIQTPDTWGCREGLWIPEAFPASPGALVILSIALSLVLSRILGDPVDRSGAIEGLAQYPGDTTVCSRLLTADQKPRFPKPFKLDPFEEYIPNI
jgi:hypothetical protein